MGKLAESANLDETPNPVTPLDAGTALLFLSERHWPGASESLR